MATEGLRGTLKELKHKLREIWGDLAGLKDNWGIRESVGERQGAKEPLEGGFWRPLRRSFGGLTALSVPS